ncbi:hypothetical protein LguiA_016285 [Lonicera macranthoides]
MGSSPSASYMRLPGDSGRFQSSDIQFLRSDRGFSTCSSPSTATRRIVSTAVQSSPGYHFTKWAESFWASCLSNSEARVSFAKLAVSKVWNFD